MKTAAKSAKSFKTDFFLSAANKADDKRGAAGLSAKCVSPVPQKPQQTNAVVHMFAVAAKRHRQHLRSLVPEKVLSAAEPTVQQSSYTAPLAAA